jgi:hypothetical protein
MKQVLQRLVVRLLVASVLAGSANAQMSRSLRITEVMSRATMDQYPTFRGTDFWELTNFGTNEFDLTGYSFSDERTNRRVSGVCSNLVIHPGESVVFVNTQPSTISTCAATNAYQFVQNASVFFQWWGAANLPANLQVRAYTGSRFDGLGDRLYLYDADGNVVDSVHFYVATPGRTFCYDPAPGVFGKVSAPGDAGVFKAALADDYGSPGSVPKPMPLQIYQEPVSQTIEMEMDVTLTVGAGGLPPPSYQWIHDGVLLTNGTAASLVISNVQPGDAGDYQVRISSGLTQLVSAVATLTVSTNPYLKILRPPSNLAAYETQGALFSISARGVPPPNYQWQANGVDIEGAIYSQLHPGICSPEMSGTVYSVRVWNEYQTNNASAKLIVSSRPRLAITEVMSLTSFGHADWFELTNYGTNEVDLLGYRFSDRTDDAGFDDFFKQPKVVKITHSIVIKPRESVIFLHHLSAEDFIRWWGRDTLPPGLQIYTYSGFTLDTCGSQPICLWNAAATDPSDVVANATYEASNSNISWVFSTNEFTGSGCSGTGDIASVLGVNGAWAAPQGGDIGSPGLTEVTPSHFLGISSYLGGVVLKCRSNPGQTIRLSRKASLTDSEWLPVSSRLATNSLPFYLFDAGARGNPMRFYRLEEKP